MKLPLLRTPLPLRHAIPLVVLVFGLAWTAIGTWLHLQQELSEARARVLDDAATVAARVADTSIADAATLQQINKNLTERFKGLHWAVVLDQNKHVIYSKDPGQLHKPYDEVLTDPAKSLATKAMQDGEYHHDSKED